MNQRLVKIIEAETAAQLTELCNKFLLQHIETARIVGYQKYEISATTNYTVLIEY